MSYASEMRGHSLLGLHGTDPAPSLAGEKNNIRDTGVESGEKMKSRSCDHFDRPLSLRGKKKKKKKTRKKLDCVCHT